MLIWWSLFEQIVTCTWVSPVGNCNYYLQNYKSTVSSCHTWVSPRSIFLYRYIGYYWTRMILIKELKKQLALWIKIWTTNSKNITLTLTKMFWPIATALTLHYDTQCKMVGEITPRIPQRWFSRPQLFYTRSVIVVSAKHDNIDHRSKMYHDSNINRLITSTNRKTIDQTPQSVRLLIDLIIFDRIHFEYIWRVIDIPLPK